jgi:hypothetical protein
MPLSNKDLSDIAREFGVSKSDMTDDKAALPNIQEQITKKEEQQARLYVPYNNANVERVIPYQVERRWLDGTTYTDITQQQIDDAAARTPTNIFFPTSWTKGNAMLTANGNGNPTSSSTNSENFVLNTTVANQGLISQINLLRNGQSSGVTSHLLNTAYSPGATSIDIDIGTQTVGKFLYISGSGTSALVLVTSASGTTIGISEIIAPASTIAINGTVVENIPGFTNTERQNLTSVSYQRILTELTNRIISSAGLWNTALGNQLAQLNINIDSATQVNTAKTNVSNAQTAYSTWSALSNTGVSGKFVDTSLNNLATAYNLRNSDIPTRVTQITTALGAVTQDSEGNYSGSGIYLQRFKCLNFLINTANGAQYQVFGLKSAKTNFEQKVANNADKLATFSNLVRYGAFLEDSKVTNSIKIDSVAQFSISDSLLLTGNDLPAIQATITGISGSTITLDKVIPKEYTKAAKAGVIKAI